MNNNNQCIKLVINIQGLLLFSIQCQVTYFSHHPV